LNRIKKRIIRLLKNYILYEHKTLRYTIATKVVNIFVLTTWVSIFIDVDVWAHRYVFKRVMFDHVRKCTESRMKCRFNAEAACAARTTPTTARPTGFWFSFWGDAVDWIITIALGSIQTQVDLERQRDNFEKKKIRNYGDNFVVLASIENN